MRVYTEITHAHTHTHTQTHTHTHTHTHTQVCRLAYELMQSFHNDDAQSFTSLDDLFYYGGQSAHRQVARFNDEGLQEGHIPLVKGQKVGVAGNHWNGYSMGTSESSLRRGLYPSIKVSFCVSCCFVCHEF